MKPGIFPDKQFFNIYWHLSPRHFQHAIWQTLWHLFWHVVRSPSVLTCMLREATQFLTSIWRWTLTNTIWFKCWCRILIVARRVFCQIYSLTKVLPSMLPSAETQVLTNNLAEIMTCILTCILACLASPKKRNKVFRGRVRQKAWQGVRLGWARGIHKEVWRSTRMHSPCGYKGGREAEEEQEE